MTTINDYLERVPSQHRDRPRFRETLTAFLSPMVRLQELLDETPRNYDVDFSVGKQLDVVGEWVGVSRYISAPLSGIYFEWDGTRSTGWNAGQWKGQYDPPTGLVALDDDTYRSLIRLYIAANRWDGTTDGAYDAWESIFDRSAIVIEDHQDMSFTIGIAGRLNSSAQKAIFTTGMSPFKPVGIQIKIYFISSDGTSPLFAWGVQTSALGGWGRAAWAEKYDMTLDR